MKKKIIVFGAFWIAAASVCPAEFRVNTYTANDQNLPDIAMSDDGSFAVAWESRGQDGDLGGVYLRRFAPNGQPLGDEFRVNTTTGGSQQQPDVAMDAVGNFVVAWESDDGSEYGIWARRYNSNGTAVTGEFLVNPGFPS